MLWWPLLSPAHSSEDSVRKHQEVRVTFVPSPPGPDMDTWWRQVWAYLSSAQRWSLTKQHLGQIGPPTQLPAGGQASLPQTWHRCHNFSVVVTRLLPIEGEEMRPFQRQYWVLVADFFLYLYFHIRPGVKRTKISCRFCCTAAAALCLAFWVFIAKAAKSQGGGGRGLSVRKNDNHSSKFQSENKHTPDINCLLNVSANDVTCEQQWAPLE